MRTDGVGGASRAEAAVPPGNRLHLMLRYSAASLVTVATIGYLAAVLVGWVSASHKLGLTEVAFAVVSLVGASIVAWPELLQAISKIRLGTLEFDLRELQRGQQNQIQQLDEMRLFLLLLLSEKERKYLVELDKGQPAPHTGDDELRAALRRLRAVGLIKNRGEHHVGEITNGLRQDIGTLVEITDDGRRYVRRIGDADPTVQPM